MCLSHEMGKKNYKMVTGGGLNLQHLETESQEVWTSCSSRDSADFQTSPSVRLSVLELPVAI